MAEVSKRGGATRRDGNPAHMKAFQDAAASIHKYTDIYGSDQMELQILGTHPNHRRHGYATALLKWGQKVAAEDEVVIVLSAGKMGVPLYKSLGFEVLCSYTVQVLGEEEKYVTTRMVFDTQKGLGGRKVVSKMPVVEGSVVGAHAPEKMSVPAICAL
jgi:GNAT superfamily N-acetyltransferase